jgi:hypothetical protein
VPPCIAQTSAIPPPLPHPLPTPQAAQSKSVPYFYHELTDSAWKTKLRLGAGPGGGGGGGGAGGGSADGAGAADGGAGGVLADEHFGLVGADRLRDKGLLLSLQAE